jgi:hypothetical protein
MYNPKTLMKLIYISKLKKDIISAFTAETFVSLTAEILLGVSFHGHWHEWEEEGGNKEKIVLSFPWRNALQ